MAQTGLQVFDKTLHTTNIWLNEIMEETGWTDRQRAYLALRATLHALRDRLFPEEAIELGAQLPMMIRGFYYEGWKMSDKPEKIRDKDEFLEKISEYFRNDPEIDTEQVVHTVFKVLSKKVTTGEIADVKNMLPDEIKELWPSAA